MLEKLSFETLERFDTFRDDSVQFVKYLTLNLTQVLYRVAARRQDKLFRTSVELLSCFYIPVAFLTHKARDDLHINSQGHKHYCRQNVIQPTAHHPQVNQVPLRRLRGVRRIIHF